MITFGVLFLTACVEFYLFTRYLDARTLVLHKSKGVRFSSRHQSF